MLSSRKRIEGLLGELLVLFPRCGSSSMESWIFPIDEDFQILDRYLIDQKI